MSRAYYNENDPKAAAWLRELIKAGLIAAGDVDERSITEVQPDDLTPYGQCHFFAGIGGWSYAFRLAGIPDDEPVWSGSCPCQPWSHAGEQLGELDPRHLWPSWFRLIEKRNPSIIFGEQVASAAALRWLDGVFANLEREDYACAASDLCAAGVRAPHIRQRLFWVAYTQSEGRCRREPIREWRDKESGGSSKTCRLAHANGRHTSEERQQRSGEQRQQPEDGSVSGLEHPEGDGREQRGAESSRRSVVGGCSTSRLGDSDEQGCERQPLGLLGSSGESYWSQFDILPCLDGKARRIEPGSFPLADGIPGRVGLLRGYGNAIVPQVAAQFIQASFEAIESLTP